MLLSRDTSHTPTPTDGSLSRTVSFAAPTFAVLRGLVEVQTTPLLGVGAFGSVYYAVLVEGTRAVALKAISKERTRAAAQRGGGQQSAQELLYGEAKLLEELATTKHRNMLRFHGWWQDEGFVYVAQQLCMGGELPEWLSRQPAYSETVAAKVTYDLLQALTHCHGLGVVHRDIKPQNLLFSSAAPDAYLKLADWGLAARWRPSDAPLAEFCGTLDFVSPEMLEGAYTATTDVWAAGVLLHLLLCGRNPFRGPSSAATEHRCVPLEAPRFPAGTPRVGRDSSPRLSSRPPRTFLASLNAVSFPPSWRRTLSQRPACSHASPLTRQPAHTLPLPPSAPYSPSRPCGPPVSTCAASAPPPRSNWKGTKLCRVSLTARAPRCVRCSSRA
jgi:serine/threonine protein kinase